MKVVIDVEIQTDDGEAQPSSCDHREVLFPGDGVLSEVRAGSLRDAITDLVDLLTLAERDY
jgi:hypothetical protein